MKSQYCSFQPLVSPFDVKRPVKWEGIFDRFAPLDIEIGFGMGEVLMREALEKPERNLIGVEQHWERVCKTLRAVTRWQAEDPTVFKNIRILKADAWIVFERLTASRSIDTVSCLFPCPWPKKGHAKHRLFSTEFLRLVNNRLKPRGWIKVVTDYYPYAQWVIEQSRWTGFHIKSRTVRPQYDTKFERKWQEEGQEEFFEIDLVKKRHVHVPVKKDRRLKSYTVKDFDISKLQLKDQTGSTSIIFKETLFDTVKQRAMIYAVVAEEHLTQHFWISIMKAQKGWKITRADGQNFFATPGIARALALVYQAVKNS